MTMITAIKFCMLPNLNGCEICATKWCHKESNVVLYGTKEVQCMFPALKNVDGGAFNIYIFQSGVSSSGSPQKWWKPQCHPNFELLRKGPIWIDVLSVLIDLEHPYNSSSLHALTHLQIPLGGGNLTTTPSSAWDAQWLPIVFEIKCKLLMLASNTLRNLVPSSLTTC